MRKQLATETPFARVLRQRGVTQKEVAEWLDVSASEVSRMKKGLIPSAPRQAVLTRRLQTSASVLWPHAYEDHNPGGSE